MIPYSLLLTLFVCHYLADFNLSTRKMLAAKAKGEELLPILAHAAVHATLMTSCLLLFDVKWQISVWLFLLQLISHFLIDLGKGKITKRYPKFADMHQKAYWQLYGFDQLLHAVVIVAMGYLAY